MLLPMAARCALLHLLGVVIVVTSVLLGGCARTHLFYDTRELRHEPLQEKQKRALVQQLASRLKDREVTWVEPNGRERLLTSDVKGLSRLPMAELGALWLATSGGDVGGENDLRVQVSKRRSVPVTVLRDLEGNVRIVSAPKGDRERAAPALSLEQIRSRFSLEGKMRGKWSAAERRALVEGLALLSSDELARVRSVRFERRALSPDGDVTRGAFFEMNGCRAVIFIYSSGVDADRYRFAGDPSRPRSAMLHSLLHEIGHAVEQSAARERFCAAARTNGARANTLIGEGNRLVSESPALGAYLIALGEQPAPTDYGNSSPQESFAESFALFHVDPGALERTRPDVYRWFAEGGHLRALAER